MPGDRVSLNRYSWIWERRLPIVEFTCTGVRPDRVRTNPMIAFDLLLYAPPYPSDPDDNLMTRSALLLAQI